MCYSATILILRQLGLFVVEFVTSVFMSCSRDINYCSSMHTFAAFEVSKRYLPHWSNVYKGKVNLSHKVSEWAPQDDEVAELAGVLFGAPRSMGISLWSKSFGSTPHRLLQNPHHGSSAAVASFSSPIVDKKLQGKLHWNLIKPYYKQYTFKYKEHDIR